MILRETLKKIVRLQKERLKDGELDIPREREQNLDMKIPHALIISGVRRCGKTTLLKHLMRKSDNFYYLNFEDQMLMDFEVSDFEKLDEVFNEICGKSNIYFLDEIQNVEGWERYVRKMQDLGKKFIITGSNASLLSKELGTKLTGRHLITELFPFSYEEMLKLKNLKRSFKSFQNYLKNGGFPEYLKYKNPEILQEYFKDIVVRDIVTRYGLKDAKIVKNLAIYLLTNVSKEMSFNKLRTLFDFGSTNTVISYVNYFEEAYLLFTISRFSYSYKKQLINPKKIYAIDVGLANANSVSFSEDKGRILENLVFLKLRQIYNDIYYFKEKNECDFLVKEKENIVELIQVCYELNEENKKREIDGLKEAMFAFKLKKGTIVTLNQKDKIGEIEVIPIWEWL